MQEETLTTLKDILIPGLSMLVAGASVYFSYRQTRLQIKKNMRVQHIDRIRDEVSELIIYLTTSHSTSNKDNIEQGNRAMARINILLDMRKSKQNHLRSVLARSIQLAGRSTDQEISAMIYDITVATHNVIVEIEDEI